ncbi:MAG TPA: glycosyltransferase family 39 protein, partial [Candidatus Limnocylindria bacterium]|nr:glycosyltransferase family 39 protein [Candidatus Limnocylindria bacterium]
MRYLREWDWDAVARAFIILGAAVRAAWVLVLHSPLDHVYSDSKTYVDTAMHLAQLVPAERFDGFYPPGTRVLLAIPLVLFGPDRDGLSAGAVLWTVLSALTPYFMWRYLRLILPPAAAALGAALCALWPLHIAYAGFFTSETPGLAFLVLSLWLAERSVRLLSSRDGLLAGLSGGIAMAMRPAFALNVILAALPLLRRVRIRAAPFLALGAGLAFVTVLVLAHEALIAGRVVGVSENSGLTFYLGHCDIRRVTTGVPETLTYQFQTPVATQLDRGRNVSFPDHQIWDQEFFYAQGLSCVAADGLAHARVIVRNIYDMG